MWKSIGSSPWLVGHTTVHQWEKWWKMEVKLALFCTVAYIRLIFYISLYIQTYWRRLRKSPISSKNLTWNPAHGRMRWESGSEGPCSRVNSLYCLNFKWSNGIHQMECDYCGDVCCKPWNGPSDFLKIRSRGLNMLCSSTTPLLNKQW